MRAILYPAAVALLSIMLIQSRCNVREAYGFTHRAQAQTERAIKVADDWRVAATNWQARLHDSMAASKGWENIATNCVMKYEEFVTAMEKRGRQ